MVQRITNRLDLDERKDPVKIEKDYMMKLLPQTDDSIRASGDSLWTADLRRSKTKVR